MTDDRETALRELWRAELRTVATCFDVRVRRLEAQVRELQLLLAEPSRTTLDVTGTTGGKATTAKRRR